MKRGPHIRVGWWAAAIGVSLLLWLAIIAALRVLL